MTWAIKINIIISYDNDVNCLTISWLELFAKVDFFFWRHMSQIGCIVQVYKTKVWVSLKKLVIGILIHSLVHVWWLRRNPSQWILWNKAKYLFKDWICIGSEAMGVYNRRSLKQNREAITSQSHVVRIVFELAPRTYIN